jgi:hypothetical protein
LQYWLLSWTRLLPFGAAYAVWIGVILLAVVLCARVFGAAWWLAGGFTLLYPTTLAIASGNNDAIILILWTAAWWCLRRGSITWSGVLAGTAAFCKLYPSIAVAVALAALSRDPRTLRRFLVGLGAAAVFQGIFIRDWIAYAPVLRQFAVTYQMPGYHSHSVPSLFGDAAPFVSAALIALWLLAARRAPEYGMSGGLAISTYVAAISFDYNLITTFPLLAQLWREQRSMALLTAGIIAVGHRNIIFWTQHFELWPARGQLLWLATVAVWLLVRSRKVGGGANGLPASVAAQASNL